MERAAKNLEDDHVHILRLTEVMEHVTYDSEPDVATLESIVDIIKNYADGLHHAKEENVYFPYLAKRGFSTSQGPVSIMLQEHVIGRNYVKGISENIALYKNGNKDALEKVYVNMRGYAELLQSHISKENNVLFRMADGVLSDDDQSKLLTEFDKIESASTLRAEYIKKIDDLAVIYQI